MSVPILEIIARKIAAQLLTISPGNGYAIACVDVIRPPRRPMHTLANGVTVLQLADIEQAGEEVGAAVGLKMYRTGVWHIDHYIEPSDDDQTPMDDLFATAIAEIERALAADYYAAFDGAGAYAGVGHNASLRAPSLLVNADGSTAGVRVVLAVSYAHTDLEPYTAL